MTSRFFLVVALAAVAASVSAAPNGKGPKNSDTLAALNCSTDQIARYNGTAWVCSDDRVGSGVGGFKLLDANGTVVLFPILEAWFGGANGYLSFEIDGAIEQFAIEAYRDTGLAYSGGVLFESTNCTGQPYLYGSKNYQWGTEREWTIVAPPDGSSPAAHVYYSVPNPTALQIVVGSVWQTVGRTPYGNPVMECGPTGETSLRPVFPIAGSISLEGLFVPPFSLVYE